MTYFLLLPVYAVALALSIIAAIAVRFVPSLRHTSAYIAMSAAVSVPAVLLANIILWLAVLGPVYVANGMAVPQGGKSAMGMLAIIALTIGPVIVTPIAIFGAVALAWRIVHRRRASRNAGCRRDEAAEGGS